jgi:protease IV
MKEPGVSELASVLRPGDSMTVPPAAQQSLVIRVEAPSGLSSRRWIHRVTLLLLLTSILLNVWFILDPLGYVRPAIHEQHVAGFEGASQRIAVINFEGTISPPFTERWIRQLQQAADDDTVRGVVLGIDSPGGFVADSHQIYREIRKLVEKKPVYVAMKRLAASGGYYIAMGIGEQGRIYAEPTTWTGSIGVIIPRYNIRELAQNFGVRMEPLVTGPLKDTLSPFRDMTDHEKVVWDAIIQDAFDRFVSVVDDGRSQLDDAAVRALATGQIYTASQALESHLVDEIGYVEDAARALADSLQLAENSWEAFEYRSTPGLVDALLGARADVSDSLTEQLLEAGIPKALYYASWNPLYPAQ